VTGYIVPTFTYSPACQVGAADDLDTVCQTDNDALSYYMDLNPPVCELEASDRAVVNDVMLSEYNPTDLQVALDSTPTFSGAAETDVIYQECATDLPATANGGTWCDDPVNGSIYRCDQQYVRIRAGEYDYGSTCHETGHSVGLVHGPQAYPVTNQLDGVLGCMRNPSTNTLGLGANQIDSINNVYL
jgi:hypothetical protein